MCEYERREPDWHDGHVIQVSATTHAIHRVIGNTEPVLRSLLFTGLLINRSKVKPWLQWLHTISFFHAAFEALAVNELRFLQLKEDKVSSRPFS
jgi:ATP-binding cassette, subfamily G (WHITE), member 2